MTIIATALKLALYTAIIATCFVAVCGTIYCIFLVGAFIYLIPKQKAYEKTANHACRVVKQFSLYDNIQSGNFLGARVDVVVKKNKKDLFIRIPRTFYERKNGEYQFSFHVYPDMSYEIFYLMPWDFYLPTHSNRFLKWLFDPVLTDLNPLPEIVINARRLK